MRADKRLACKTVQRVRTIADFERTLRLAQARGEGPSTGTSEKFFGPTSIEEYERILRDGWPHAIEGVEGLEGLSSDASERISFVRNVGGAFPVVPAHLAGVPYSMLMPTSAPRENIRALTLVIDCCFSFSVRPAAIVSYAEAVMRLLAWSVTEQLDVSVYAIVAIGLEGTKYLYTCEIHGAGMTLQPARIASVLHPCFLRRGWFSMLEHEYYDLKLPGTEQCEYGYGEVATATTTELQQALPDLGSVVLLPEVGNWAPEAAIREAVNLKLKVS